MLGIVALMLLQTNKETNLAVSYCNLDFIKCINVKNRLLILPFTVVVMFLTCFIQTDAQLQNERSFNVTTLEGALLNESKKKKKIAHEDNRINDGNFCGAVI